MARLTVVSSSHAAFHSQLPTDSSYFRTSFGSVGMFWSCLHPFITYSLARAGWYFSDWLREPTVNRALSSDSIGRYSGHGKKYLGQLEIRPDVGPIFHLNGLVIPRPFFESISSCLKKNGMIGRKGRVSHMSAIYLNRLTLFVLPTKSLTGPSCFFLKIGGALSSNM